MRISSKKPFYKRKKVVALFLIIFVIITGATVFALRSNDNKSTNPSSGKAKPEKTEKKESVKQESVASDSEQEKEAVRVSDSVASSDSIEAPNITRAEQIGDFIRVSAIFNNPSNGKCILKFEQAGQTRLQKEAPVVIGPSYYACNGFRVPRSELPNSGGWNIIIIHELNGKTARASKELDVQ